MPKTICLTVTNTLTYDQRMARICYSLQKGGYHVILIGRQQRPLPSLQKQPYKQIRLNMIFQKGKLFYCEYNLRLFLFLLFRKTDIICAIDLDTIFPCLLISKIKRIPRVYDAHELFTELKEVVSRPFIHKFWLWIERKSVPKFRNGYTVNQFISDEMKRRYSVNYSVIRNLPVTSSEEIDRLNMADDELLAALPPKFFSLPGCSQ